MAPGGSLSEGGNGSQRNCEKHQKTDRSENGSESEGAQDMRKMSKFEEEGGFKFVVKFKDNSDKALNPLKLSESLKDKMGNILNVKMMLNGNILVFCKSEAQRLKAIKVHHLLNKPVEYLIPRQAQNAKRVIHISPKIKRAFN